MLDYTQKDKVLFIFGFATAKARNDDTGMFEYMVNRMNQYPLNFQTWGACMAQLFIIVRVFQLKCKEGLDRMIDDGLFSMMIETHFKSEDLQNTNKGENGFDIKDVLLVIGSTTQVGGPDTTLKIVIIFKRYPQIMPILIKYMDQIPHLRMIVQLMVDI